MTAQISPDWFALGLEQLGYDTLETVQQRIWLRQSYLPSSLLSVIGRSGITLGFLIAAIAIGHFRRKARR